jgi:hypothetical protein
LIVLGKYYATVNLFNTPPLLLPFSIMGLEDEGQRTELTREERERRATVPLLRRLVSEQHRQEQQRIEADARTRWLPQEMQQDLDAYNMENLQAESEALDLRTEVSLHRSAVSVHRRTSSSLHIQEDKTVLPPPIRGVILEGRPQPAQKEALWPRPVQDHLDSLIVLTTTCVDVLLGLMLNPVESHLNSLVQVEAGAQLPPFCLVTQDLPSMSLNRLVVAGPAGPSNIGKPSAQSGTKPLPIPAGRLRDKQLRKIKEGILQHNQECRDVQEHLNRERQRLHRVAIRYASAPICGQPSSS